MMDRIAPVTIRARPLTTQHIALLTKMHRHCCDLAYRRRLEASGFSRFSETERACSANTLLLKPFALRPVFSVAPLRSEAQCRASAFDRFGTACRRMRIAERFYMHSDWAQSGSMIFFIGTFGHESVTLELDSIWILKASRSDCLRQIQ